METIIIKGIEVKDSGLVIVKYNGNREATMNTKWQSQEVDYMEKDVGVGGEVSVEIKVNGEYTKRTKVDLSSAKKNTTITESEKIVDTPQETGGSHSQREVSIMAQGFCKCVFYGQSNVSPLDVLENYKFFVKEIEKL